MTKQYYINFQNPAGQPATTRTEGEYRFVTVDGKEYFQVGTEDYDADKGYGWYAPGDVHWKTHWDSCSGGTALQKSIVYSDWGRKATFEFALPPGTYNVTASIGRYCRNVEDKQALTIEGTVFFENVQTSTCMAATHEVHVTDGLLTMEMGDQSNSDYTFLNYLLIEAATLPDPEPGDLNCDGFFNLPDVAALLQLLAGRTDVSPANCPGANGDYRQNNGQADLADAVSLLRHIAEIP